MKTCRHFDTDKNGKYINLLKEKPNHNYICSGCFRVFTKNDYHNLTQYCSLMNIDNLGFFTSGALAQIEILHTEIPRPVSYEDRTY